MVNKPAVLLRMTEYDTSSTEQSVSMVATKGDVVPDGVNIVSRTERPAPQSTSMIALTFVPKLGERT